MRFVRSGLVSVRTTWLMSLALLAAPAAAISVTTTDDEDGVNPAACALREALEAVNTGASFGGCAFSPGDTEILLPAGTYTFIADSLGGRPVRILTKLTLRGAGSSVTEIDLGSIAEIAGIAIAASGEVILEDLTIANGAAVDMAPAISYTGSAGGNLVLRGVVVRDNFGYFPGGMRLQLASGGRARLERVHFLRNENSGVSASAGGAVLCLASGTGAELTIVDSIFELNQPSDEGGVGGGVYNLGCSLRLDRVTFVANKVFGGDDGAPSTGGAGLASFTVAGITHEVWLNNVTFVGNEAEINAAGGGVLLVDQSTGSQTSWLSQVTFVGNLGAGGGHDIAVYNTPVTVTNVLFGTARGAGGCELATPLISGGGNLDTDGSCGLTGLGDQTAVDPGLAPALADNGGFTPTLALLPGSPAIDSGNPGVCAATDQRGVFRPQDSDGYGSILCDVGAYEVESVAFLFGDGFESGDTGAWTLTVQ